MADSASRRRSRGRPTTADVARIEQALLAAALAEFVEQGYGGASMTRIAHAAGASKTTLYSRYPTKGDLFMAIVREQIDSLSPATPLTGEGTTHDLAAGLRRYANHMLRLNLEGDLLHVNRLIYSESQRFPELGEAAAERTRLGIERISRFIRECATAEGRTCKDPDAPAELFILSLRGWFINVMLGNRRVGKRERERWVERLVGTLLGSAEEW